MKQLFAPDSIDHIDADSKQRYGYWRWRIFSSIYFGYIFFSFTRRAFVHVMDAVERDLHISHHESGWIYSSHSIAYGLSKFFSGILSDRSNPRYFMAVGLIATGIINLLLANSSYLSLFFWLWTLNGCFQGWGAPPCAKLLSYWFSHGERGRWWGIWSTSQTVGLIAMPFLISKGLNAIGWRYTLYIPAMIAIIGGCILIYRLRDTPQSLGLPPIEKESKQLAAQQESVKQKGETASLVKAVLSNPGIWLLAITYFFVYFVRIGFGDRWKTFLREYQNYPELATRYPLAAYDIGGFLGVIAAGWISDKLFRGDRTYTNISFLLLLTTVLGLFWADHCLVLPLSLSENMRSIWNICASGLIGFAVMGPQMLIGLMAAEMVDKRSTGMATGFVGLTAYFGATIAGGPFGHIIDKDPSWERPLFALLFSSIIALSTSLSLLIYQACSSFWAGRSSSIRSISE